MPAIVACFGALLQSNMAGPIYPLWQDELGFAPGVINILFAVYPAGVLVALFGVMRLLRSYTWRSALIVSAWAGIVAAGLFVLAEDPWTLGVGRFICGISVGIVLSAGASTITATLERRGVRAAARIAAIIISAGFACGALFAGILADHAARPTRLTFELELVALVGCLAYLWLDPGLKTIDAHHRARVADQRTDARGLPMLPVAHRTRALSTATWVFVSCGMTCAVFQSIGSAYLRDLLGASTATVSGLLVFLLFGSAFAGQVLLAGAHTRTQAWTAMGAGGLGAALMVTGVLSHSVLALFVAAALTGASQGLGQAVGFTIARQATDLRGLPGVLGKLNVLAYGLAGGGIFVTSPLVNAAGVGVAIAAIAAVVLALTAVAAAVTARWQRTFFHVPAAALAPTVV